MERFRQWLSQGMSRLLLLSAFSVFLAVVRIVVSSDIRYVFLAWNLFLAWIPAGFAVLYRKSVSSGKPFWRNGLLLTGWLIFLPNAPYILTDLVHLKTYPNPPSWFDWLMLTSFGWTGFLVGCWSMAEVWRVIRNRWPRRSHLPFLVMVLLATAFGVYLGRFERLNSWDLLLNPLDTAGNILRVIFRPQVMAMTILFSLFLSLAWGGIRAVVRHSHDE